MPREVKITPDSIVNSGEYFEYAIDGLDEVRRGKLEGLKTHFSEWPFIVEEENSAQAKLIQEARGSEISDTLIDFVILKYGISEKSEKEQYLKSKYDSYFHSLYFPDYILLAISQDLDLGNLFPEETAKTQ